MNRYQPTASELAAMTKDQLKTLAEREAVCLKEQKQTSVSRLLSELARRI